MKLTGKSRWLYLAASVLALGLLVVAARGIRQPAAVADTSSWIIQHTSTRTAGELVRQVGGMVTHELGIVRAVAAQLTDEQAVRLRRESNARVLPDASVKLATTSCEIVAGTQLGFDGRRVLWHLTNTGGAPVLIDSISAGWPSENRKLKKIKLDGDEIHAVAQLPTSATIVSDWHKDSVRREIAPGATEELRFEFESDATQDPEAYSFAVGFAQGCSVGFALGGNGDQVADDGGTSDGGGDPPPTPPAECLVSGQNTLGFNKNKVEWILTNNGAATARLDRVDIIWPGNAAGLKKVRLGSDIFQGLMPAPRATIGSGWRGSEADRELPANDSETLRFEFESTAVSDPGKYTIALGFADGCTLEYAAAGVLEDGYSTLATHYPSLIDADRLHSAGITGRGVTVAFLDTGNSLVSSTIHYNADSQWRYLAQYSATGDYLNEYGDPFFGQTGQDVMGHGSHLISAALSAKSTADGKYNGVAPGADLVTIRAFGGDGSGYYSDVIRGIDWAVRNKDRYGIRVLNMSFSATPVSHYWDDPLNQAVMAAWQAGIVVVASAGNDGPDPMTIGVPGNVPYIITVGAMTDNYTASVVDDDRLASFSSTGPTLEGFVKPEVVAPGGHILGTMGWYTTIGENHPEYRVSYPYYSMSGTSQAAAVTTGVVALMLQADPSLSPNDVKCRLMASARPAVKTDGTLAYSVFQQGAGLVNAYDAAYATNSGCANRGIDIGLDLAGSQHYRGRANLWPDGTYYLDGLEGDGFLWSEAFLWSEGFLWSDAFVWSDAFLWSDAFVWSDAFLWSDGFLWSDAFVVFDGFLWSDSLTETMSVNVWVEEE